MESRGELSLGRLGIKSWLRKLHELSWTHVFCKPLTLPGGAGAPMGIILCLSHHFMTNVGGRVSSVSYAFRSKETLLKKLYPKSHLSSCTDVNDKILGFQQTLQRMRFSGTCDVISGVWRVGGQGAGSSGWLLTGLPMVITSWCSHLCSSLPWHSRVGLCDQQHDPEWRHVTPKMRLAFVGTGGLGYEDL